MDHSQAYKDGYWCRQCALSACAIYDDSQPPSVCALYFKCSNLLCSTLATRFSRTQQFKGSDLRLLLLSENHFSLQCTKSVLLNKIVSNEKDLVGVVFFGTVCGQVWHGFM